MLRRRALTLASLHRSTKPSFSHSTAPNCNPTRLFSASLLQSRNQNRLDIRCLFVCRNGSSPSSSISTGALMYRLTGARFMATRAMNDSSNRPPKETILLDGCDFEHWLVVVEPPDPNLTRDEIIDSYIKTLAQVVGSEEEARMKIYSVSTKHYFAFGCLVPEELSYKIKELPHVRWVLPDSYLDVKNKDYGGEPFINGQAVPYDPKYHALWVKNHEESMRKNNRRDRTRDVDRRRNIQRTEGMSMQRAPNPPTTPTQNTSSLASTVGNQNLMSKPSYQNQERPLPNFSNQNVQRQLQMQNPDGLRTRMPPPMQNHPDGQRMGMPPQMQVLDGQRMGMLPQMQNPDGQRMGMPTQMQNPDGHRMGMPPQMQNPDGQRMGMATQMQNPNGQRMGMPTQMQNPDGQRMGMATQMQNPDGQRMGMATQMQNPDGQRTGMATQMQNPDGQRMGMPPQVVNNDFQNRNMSPQMPNPDVQNIHAPQSMQHPNIRNMDVVPPASNGNILNRNPRLPAQSWNHQSRTMQYPVQNSNFEAPDTPPSIQNQNFYNRGTQPPVENHGIRVPNGIQYHDAPYRNMQNVQPGDYGNMRAMPNGSDYTSMGNEQSRYYQGGNLQSNVNNGNAQNTNYDGWSSSNGMDMGSSPSSRGYQSHEEYGAVANGNH